MKTMSRLWTLAVVGLLSISAVSAVWADGILPPFPSTWNPGDEVKGESILKVSNVPDLRVDWTVRYFGNNVWGYFYQLENFSVFRVASFTIRLPGPLFFVFGQTTDNVDAGFVDPVFSQTVTGHNVSGEAEPSPGDIDPATSSAINIPPPPFVPSINWTFDDPRLAAKNQSGLLYGYANVPPMYGFASAHDGGFSWQGTVPVPSPEPGAAALLVMGLVGVGFLYRRRSSAK